MLPIGPISEELFGYGVLGVAALVQGFINWILWKAYHKAQEKITDLMATMLPVIEANNRITASHTVGLDTRNRITEGLTTAVEKNTTELEHISDQWAERWRRMERLLEKLGG